MALFATGSANAERIQAVASSQQAVNAPYDFAHAITPPSKAQLQAGIDDVLRRTPGATQIDATTIQMAPGFYVGLPAPASPLAVRSPHAVTPHFTCPLLDVCVWVDSSFTGTYAYFTTCGLEWDLGKSAFPGGGVWNDKISSITNNQSTGVNSYFYNYTGSYWSQLLDVPSGTHRSNLALDSSDDGTGSPNDRIDGIHVCGSAPDPWAPNHSGPLPPP